jgi:peptidoglycan-associated lipoprotein
MFPEYFLCVRIDINRNPVNLYDGCPFITVLHLLSNNISRRLFMKNALLVLATLVVAACAATPPKTETAPSANEAKPVAAAPAAETESSKLAAEIKKLENESVYFDFDKSAVKPEYHDVVRAQAEFIKAHKNDIVTLQGNCDERGSREYNLALGMRRAKSVAKSLEIAGVPAAQIKEVSFGEEKPRLSCHEEKCWKENRRADFVHKLD